MPKKKAAGKKKKEASGPSDADLKKIDALKLFYKGYQKRCDAAQIEPLPAVTAAYKAAVRESKPLIHLVLDAANFHAPTPASRSGLAVLLTSVRETGYAFLSELFLWNCELAEDDIGALAHHIGVRLDLKALEMMGCTLAENTVEILVKGIGFNQSIKKINFSFVNLGDEGLRLFCLHNAHNDTLKELRLHRCGLTAEAGAVLRRYLPAVALQSANFEGNRLGFKGLEELSHAFPELDSLKDVSLQENGIDIVDPRDMDDILESLHVTCENLKKPTGLKTLNMSFNNIGDECGAVVLEALKARKELGLPGLQVIVGHRMRSELFEAIQAAGKSAKSAAGKKKKKGKGGKKKKKK